MWRGGPWRGGAWRGGGVAELRGVLGELGLRAYTFNGFPYGDFHQPVVKHAVYEPDWTTPRRLSYTLDLARVLAALLVDKDAAEEGSISTLPIGWPRGDGSDGERLAEAGRGLRELAAALRRLEDETGRCIHVDLEPEPGCLLSGAWDVVRFFEEHLLPGGDEATLRRHIRVCHDVCHAAVMFGRQAEELASYRAAGVRVGKVQLSSAVWVRFDRLDEADRDHALRVLRTLAEPR